MAEIWMNVNTAVEFPLNLIPLVSSVDGITRLDGVTFDAAGMDLVYTFTDFNGVIVQTPITPADSGNYTWTHSGSALYKISIPASGGFSVNNNAAMRVGMERVR